jgi:hypothetical protein
MQIESCKDCLNLNDRRSIDNAAFCAIHHEPSLGCQEFKAKPNLPKPRTPQAQFCVNCLNFDCVDDVPLCTKNHRSGIGCYAFQKRKIRLS